MATKTAEQQATLIPNRLAVVYDPDREQLRPLAGRRSLRSFSVSWFTRQGREPATEEFRFEPGVNWIPAQTWEQIKGLEPVQQRLQVGALRPFQPREVGESESTTRYSEEDAKILVDNTWDLVRLDNWFRTERRPSVQNYIQARIEAIRMGRV
jgi:hypothetical protein